MFFIIIQPSLQAQDIKFTKSPWWIGVAGGVNQNIYHGSAQIINSDLSISSSFQNRKGNGLFAFPLIEYHRPEKRLGFMLQAGYESRKGSFDEMFSTKLAYITVEPSVRLNLFNSPLYLYTGPRFAFNTDKRFTYEPGNNSPEISGVFSDMKKSLISMQVGFGYDLSLKAKDRRSQVILAPFVAFHPYFGQNPRTIESWNLTTIRAGLALKFGRGIRTSLPEKIYVPVVISPEPQKSDLITDINENESSTIDSNQLSEENNVYFDLRSSGITDPFTKSGRDQLRNFKKDQFELLIPENLSDSIFRKVIVDDNFLKILGRSMSEDSSGSISLIGSSKLDRKAGLQIAESVKIFLTGVYGIDVSRIQIKDQRKLKIHRRQSGKKFELAVIRQEDRQVLVKTKSKSLATKIKDGQDSPVKIYDVPGINPDGFISFTTAGYDKSFSSWSLKITDNQGEVRNFGPYTTDFVNIPKKYILGAEPAYNSQISMIGQLESGQIVRKDTNVYLAAWPVYIIDKVMRFSFLYDFNNSKSISVFSRYLKDIVTPQIPSGAKVVIHGHSESLNYGDYDLKSLLFRKNDARRIIENSLVKANVKFQVFDFNEDQTIAPFQRVDSGIDFNNRMIIIDVIKP